jgi:xyloglucan-specific exo-beta-1,4-glucanase
VNTYYTKDKGATWRPILASVALKSKPVADRVNPNKVFLYVSGFIYECTYNSSTAEYDYTNTSVGTGGSNIIRSVPGNEGDIWIPLYNDGLKRYTQQGTIITKLASVSTCDAVGFGKAGAGKTYPAVYMWGTPVGGVLGIHRSDDLGETWTRINDDAHEFGGPGNGNFVTGDRNVYGRAFMSTAGRGLVYGETTSETGFSYPKPEKKYMLYPNPTGNILSSNEKVQRIEIFTLNGEKLFETNESVVSVGKLVNGCYLARLYTLQGIYNQLFIKN